MTAVAVKPDRSDQGGWANRRLLFIAVQFAGVLSVIFLVYWLYGEMVTEQQLGQLLHSELFYLALIVCAGGLVVQALLLRAVIQGTGRSLQLWDVLLLTFSSSFLNYIPGKPGLVLKAWFLKFRARMTVGTGAVFLAHAQLVLLSGAGAVGILGVLGGFATEGSVPLELFSLLPLFVLLACLHFLIPQLGRLPLDRWWVGRAVLRMMGREEKYAELTGRSNSWVTLFFWAVGAMVVGTLRLSIVANLVEIDLSISHSLIVQALAATSVVLALLPGNLGVREAAVVFLLVALGSDLETGLQFAIVDRLVSVVLLFTVGPVAAVTLWWRSR